MPYITIKFEDVIGDLSPSEVIEYYRNILEEDSKYISDSYKKEIREAFLIIEEEIPITYFEDQERRRIADKWASKMSFEELLKWDNENA